MKYTDGWTEIRHNARYKVMLFCCICCITGRKFRQPQAKAIGRCKHPSADFTAFYTHLLVCLQLKTCFRQLFINYNNFQRKNNEHFFSVQKDLTSCQAHFYLKKRLCDELSKFQTKNVSTINGPRTITITITRSVLVPDADSPRQSSYRKAAEND